MFTYHKLLFLNRRGILKLPKWRTIVTGKILSAFSKTEVSIPIPISGGHLAAQLWEGDKCLKSIASAYPTPILFMHGYRDNSNSFDPLIPLIIQENMTLVSVDQPGHGLSSHLKGGGYDVLLDGLITIHRVMQFFGWTHVTLIGHSFGSILSFVFTGMNPDIVHKYVAIENLQPFDIFSHLEKTIKTLFEVEARLKDPNKKQPSYPYEVLFQIAMKAREGTVTEEGVTTLLKRGAIPNVLEPNLFHFSHDVKTTIVTSPGFSEEDVLKLAHQIKCPVCVIKGDPGKDFVPREALMKVCDAIKTANNGKLEFHLVPGTHHLHLNDPSSVAPIISDFLHKKF